MVLQNFFGPALPADLQMVATYKPDNVLRNAYQNFVTKRYREVLGPYDLLRPGGLGVCFNQLIVGDGGYVEASRRSLSASGSGSAKEHSRHYQEVGTFFSSNNWWQFRQHVLQVSVCWITRVCCQKWGVRLCSIMGSHCVSLGTCKKSCIVLSVQDQFLGSSGDVLN